MHSFWKKLGVLLLFLRKYLSNLAKKVCSKVNYPVIGIGAGNHVDGQVLVMHDLLGLTTEFNPRFIRRYLNLNNQVSDAVKSYVSDIKKMNFPNDEEMY